MREDQSEVVGNLSTGAAPFPLGLAAPSGDSLSARWFHALYETPLLFSGLLDATCRVLEANQYAIEGCGFDRGQTIGTPFWECGWWRPDVEVADQVRTWCEEVVSSGQPLRTSSKYFVASGEERVVDLSLIPVHDERGVVFVVASGRDITDGAAEADALARRELAAAESGRRRAASQIAKLSRVALDLVRAESVTDLERAVIGSGLSVLGAQGGGIAVRNDRRGVVALASSASLEPQVQIEHRELPLDSPLAVASAARTGTRVLLPTVRSALDWSPAMAEVASSRGRGAWAALPLHAGERLIGALDVSWVDERDFTSEEVALLDVFAALCGQALDRVQHLVVDRAAAHAAQQMSETLQRSLLTQPPTPEALDIAVRYQPASEAAQVGGDWYDAFVNASGATMLVVGDVSGHDQTAAATMGQVRNLLRGLAFDSDDGPARLLERLDAALNGLELDTLATAVLARVESSPSAPAGTRRLRWSNAGHLPPLLRTVDGAVVRL
ncbi:MAG TPA: SpoIIE family protein phosphatase, partial [Actinomycetes bacterium]|nr:SpoIIE family protein phosphatase [Actinomycetes bacterium]